MCCDWWKRRAQAKYKVSPRTYQAIASTLNAIPTLNNLSLHVADNSFGADKAEMVYNMVKGRQLTAFTFSNRAIDFDWKEQ